MTAPSSWIFDVKADEFEQQVIHKSSEVPVIVDFWAPWCQPCQLLAPIIEQANYCSPKSTSTTTPNSLR